MVSTAIILVVLIGLFLLGIKWTIDVIREWPRKKPLSSYFEELVMNRGLKLYNFRFLWLLLLSQTLLAGSGVEIAPRGLSGLTIFLLLADL
jgi:hypothetical protein